MSGSPIKLNPEVEGLQFFLNMKIKDIWGKLADSIQRNSAKTLISDNFVIYTKLG